MATHHTPQEEAALKAKSTRELAKMNNRMLNEALVSSSPDVRLKHSECRQLVREELAARGILESSAELRLISGTEIPQE